MWSGIPTVDACISFLPVIVKRCLAADRRNPDRDGRAFMKRSMAPVPPPRTLQPPLGSTAGITHLFIPGPGEKAARGGGGQELGKRTGCMGRSCYTCQRGWLGQATGGFSSKSDKLTSRSPLHEADIELANLVCTEGMKVQGAAQHMPIFCVCGATGDACMLFALLLYILCINVL